MRYSNQNDINVITMAKKKAKQPNKQPEKTAGPFYVGITTPHEIRRYILQGAKDTVTILKQLEHIKQIRENKAQSIAEFQNIIRDIKASITKIRKSLPTVPLKQSQQDMEKAVHTPITQEKEEEPIIHSTKINEIDRLESELRSIEQKLQKI